VIIPVRNSYRIVVSFEIPQKILFSDFFVERIRPVEILSNFDHFQKLAFGGIVKSSCALLGFSKLLEVRSRSHGEEKIKRGFCI
jgi:hypothetical protein